MSKKEEKSYEYVKKLFENGIIDSSKEYDNICNGFESGWDESLKQILVDARKELPEYDEDVLVINEVGEKFFCHRSNDPNVVVDKDGWCNYSGSDIVAWVRNVTFDEILEANKDVLQRLKDK